MSKEALRAFLATNPRLGLPRRLNSRRGGALRRPAIAFDAFIEDNDPHGEHDFGAFDHAGHRIFWKIDYYDQAIEFGSEDPADPDKTMRALTIMLAEEY
jgi:hypothetical protein